MRELVESEEYFNRRLIRNNRLLAGSLFFFHTATIILTALAILPAPSQPATRELMVVTGVAVLQLVGLPLVWAASRNLQWSALGVGLLVGSVSFQSYFLAASLWERVGIASGSPQSWSIRTQIFLDSSSLLVSTQATAVQAFKCGMANSIVFAAIQGRAGPLQAFIVSVLGTFLFELNRQLVSRYALDMGGSISVFLFAGCFGSTLAIILFRWAHTQSAKDHPLKRAGKFSLGLAGLGSLICWVFFPWLSLDCPSSLGVCSRAGLNGVFCVSACVLTCVGLSCLVRGKLLWRQILGSPIAGGVAAATAGALTNSPLAALLLGVVAGLLHLILLRMEPFFRKYLMIENNVLFLFGIQGLLGGLASALFLHLVGQEDVYAADGFWKRPDVGGQLAGSGIAVGMGVASGLLVSPLVCWVRGQTRCDHYHDRAYWVMDEALGKYGPVSETSQEESSSDAEHLKSETVKEVAKNRFALL